MNPEESNNKDLSYQEDLGVFWKAFGFLFPFAGVIMYFYQKNQGADLKAKSAVVATVAGMIFGLLNYLMLDYFGFSQAPI